MAGPGEVFGDAERGADGGVGERRERARQRRGQARRSGAQA